MSNVGDFIILDFKLYYRVIVMKTTSYWSKSRNEMKRNRIQNRRPRNKSTCCSHFIFDNEAKTYIGKKPLQK
jgi:hypothetical protein